MGLRPRCPDRLPRRLRPRRGGRAGGLRGRGRPLAARRRARQPGRLADLDGAQPGHRPHPPQPHPGGEDAGARGARGDRGHHGRDDDLPRRAARAHLHLLPSGARHRGPGRAHPAHARRADDPGDRARVPRRRADDGAAAGAGEAQDQGGRDPVPGAARPPAARPPRRRAGGRLPGLQPGLRAHPRRPGGRGAAARPLARRADARRAGGPRPAGDDAAARGAPRGALPRRRAGAARRPGPLALGSGADRRRPRCRSTARSPCAAAGRT